MQRSRRHILRLAAGAAAVPIAPRIAKAQAYPARPVRIVVTTAPGSARRYPALASASGSPSGSASPSSSRTARGAGNNIGTEAVVRSRPRRLHAASWSRRRQAINATLYDKLNFNFIRDIAPVASLVTCGQRHDGALRSFPVRSVPGFIAYAKAHPGTINTVWATGGGSPGTSSELFKMMTGVEHPLHPLSRRGLWH